MRIRILSVAMVCLALGGAALAQTSRSAAVAEKLMDLLQQRQMRYVAAAEPGEEGQYAAAMLVGDSQLFVVSARVAQPALMDQRLSAKDYEGAYLDLNSASVPEGKLFVQDLGAPGLHPDRGNNEPFDVVYESVVHRTAFDGDWESQDLSRDAYREAFEKADARYEEALKALVTALDEAGTGR